MYKKCSLFFVLSLFLGILLVPGSVSAQEDIGGSPGESVWAVTDVRVIGYLDISEEDSWEYIGDNRVEAYQHAFHAAAEEGQSRVFNVLNLVPAVNGHHFSSVTSMGYDSLGTDGLMNCGEEVSALVCTDKSGLGMSAGFEGELARGSVHTNIRMSPIMSPTAFYNFSGRVAEGRVATGVVVRSGSGNAEGGLASQSNYSQQITAEGEFYISHTARVGLGKGWSSCIW